MWRGLGDVEGVLVVVDAHAVGVSLLCLVVSQLSCFVVVEVMCGRRGGRPLLRWWLWEEEGSCVTLCDVCDCWINVQMCVHVIILVPKFVVSNTQLYSVPLNFVVSTFSDYKHLHCLLFSL